MINRVQVHYFENLKRSEVIDFQKTMIPKYCHSNLLSIKLHIFFFFTDEPTRNHMVLNSCTHLHHNFCFVFRGNKFYNFKVVKMIHEY